jgi:hypothetical protein
MQIIRILCAIMAFWVITSVLGATPAVKVITANPGKPPEENDISGYCSLACALSWQVKASSYLKPQGRKSYDVRKMDDGLVNTAWIEGIKGYGVGENITFIFTEKNFKEAHLERINFNGFLVINGYCKDKKSWKENSRVKRIRVAHNDQPRYEAILHDSMNVQDMRFPETIWLHPGDTVKVTIMEVYPGEKYQDTAISELIPLGAH